MSPSNTTTNIYSLYSPYSTLGDAKATFQTHLNYVRRMYTLTDGLEITIIKPGITALDIHKVEKFERLAQLTRDNITAEIRACNNEQEYALIAAPWMPVKCYYALYYLESVFIYLLNSSTGGFSHGGHTLTRNSLRSAIVSEQVLFTGTYSADVTKVVTVKMANEFKTTGSTLSPDYYRHVDCSGSIRKKLAEYIERDWKLTNKIENYLTRDAKTARGTKLHPKEFCLLDFFYWMRIKANYRDLDFLDFDNAVSKQDAHEYAFYYTEATEQYAKALTDSIRLLKLSRRMRIS